MAITEHRRLHAIAEPTSATANPRREGDTIEVIIRCEFGRPP